MDDYPMYLVMFSFDNQTYLETFANSSLIKARRKAFQYVSKKIIELGDKEPSSIIIYLCFSELEKIVVVGKENPFLGLEKEFDYYRENGLIVDKTKLASVCYSTDNTMKYRVVKAAEKTPMFNHKQCTVLSDRLSQIILISKYNSK